MRLPMQWLQKWVIEDLNTHFLSDSSTKEFQASFGPATLTRACQAALSRMHSAEMIADALTNLGIEVDAVEGVPHLAFALAAKNDPNKLVVAKVQEVTPHPNAQKLRIAKVFDGQKTFQVVCGAANCSEGIYVAFAKDGAKLFPFSSDIKKSAANCMEIQTAELRGQTSEGMLCAFEEIGFAPNGEGIIDFESLFAKGEDFWHQQLGSSAFDLLLDCKTQPVFELGLTPNLAHCFSAAGVTRELCAAYGLTFFQLQDLSGNKPKEKKPRQLSMTLCSSQNCSRYCSMKVLSLDAPCCTFITREPSLPVPRVHIHEDSACVKYSAAVVEGFSPALFSQQVERCRSVLLQAAGERPLNPIVDLTNEVLLDFGHPVHAFDADKIEGDLHIRLGQVGERATTLDGVERAITPEMTVIADEKKVLAIAGIMGCLSSCVDMSTTRVLFEVAYFEPGAVRKMSKQLALSTNASKRFERGIDRSDEHIVMQALIESVYKLCNFDDALQCSAIVTEVAKAKEINLPPTVTVSLKKVEAILGLNIESMKLKKQFQQLGIVVQPVDEHTWQCTAPTWRHDLELEVDYAEEVFKLIGISNVSDVVRPAFSDATSKDAPIWTLEKVLRHRLAAMGYAEIITPDLVEYTLQKELGFTEEKIARVLNPSHQHMNSCRASLLPNMLQQAKQMQARGDSVLQFFEIGSIYQKNADGTYSEKRVVSLALSIEKASDWRLATKNENDFFDFKKDVVGLLSPFGDITTPATDSAAELLEKQALHPGQQAHIMFESRQNKEKQIALGFIGLLHPSLRRLQEISGGLLVAQIELEPLLSSTPSLLHNLELGQNEKKNSARKTWAGEDYPLMSRDLTLSVETHTTVASILTCIESNKVQLQKIEEIGDCAQLLRQVELLSIFKQKNDVSNKNVTFRFIYRHKNRTLKQEEVDLLHKTIVESVQKELVLIKN